MIGYVDAWLDMWAQWSKLHVQRLGHASTSTVYTMMTRNKATVTAKAARGRRRMIAVGGRLVQRDIEPMRSVESQRAHLDRTPDDPVSEQMEEAVSHLRETIQKEALRMKYILQYNDDLAAHLMGISKTVYKSYLNVAHAALDSYLRAKYPATVKRLSGDVKLAEGTHATL